MMKQPYIFVFIGALVVCSLAGAWSSRTVIVQKDHVVPSIHAEGYHWPTGTLDLVNDPARTRGFEDCFSELACDVRDFQYRLDEEDDLQRVIHLLAAIDHALPELIFLPRRHPEGVDAVFAIGSQPIVDQWYENLEEVEPGVKGFGLGRYERAPIAQAPTLYVYAGNACVDISNLELPHNVQIEIGEYYSEGLDGVLVAKIEGLLENFEANKTLH